MYLNIVDCFTQLNRMCIYLRFLTSPRQSYVLSHPTEVIGAGAEVAERLVYRVRRTYAAMRTVTCGRWPLHGAEGGVMQNKLIGRWRLSRGRPRGRPRGRHCGSGMP